MNLTLPAETVFFSSKGQMVMPRRLRKEFEIEEGTQAYVEATPEGILIKPVTRKFIRTLRGSLKGKGALNALLADRKAERDR